MTPDRFDELTRLWAAAPSRRVFLLQVGTVFVLGAMARAGIRPPRWMPDARHGDCYPERDGMPCGHCGICQRSQCLPVPVDPCPNWGVAVLAGGSLCAQCDPKTATCTFCKKGQHCCKDGCCDGACTADGACCPPEKQCGEECCRGCDVCQGGKCQKPEPKTECPPNYSLVDGCCVCTPARCGGECCPEDQTCLGGKCCKTCGRDKAVCCDDRVCCRDRCRDPREPCCPCWEDISPQEGEKILKGARDTMKQVQEVEVIDKEGNLVKIEYGQDRDNPGVMDCTLFTAHALGTLVKTVGPPSSRTYDGNCNFRRLDPGEPPRAGDVLAQPRSGGPPGSQHAGVATGARGPNGLHQGIAMGNSGARDTSLWGPMENGGWFEGGDQLHVYRPQKPKKGCK